MKTQLLSFSVVFWTLAVPSLMFYLNGRVLVAAGCQTGEYNEADIAIWRDFHSSVFTDKSQFCADENSLNDPCCACKKKDHDNVYVHCEMIKQKKYIASIFVRNNNLEGKIPTSLTKLNQLYTLDLRGNPKLVSNIGGCISEDILCEDLSICRLCDRKDCAKMLCEDMEEAEEENNEGDNYDEITSVQAVANSDDVKKEMDAVINDENTKEELVEKTAASTPAATLEKKETDVDKQSEAMQMPKNEESSEDDDKYYHDKEYYKEEDDEDEEGDDYYEYENYEEAEDDIEKQSGILNQKLETKDVIAVEKNVVSDNKKSSLKAGEQKKLIVNKVKRMEPEMEDDSKLNSGRGFLKVGAALIGIASVLVGLTAYRRRSYESVNTANERPKGSKKHMIATKRHFADGMGDVSDDGEDEFERLRPSREPFPVSSTSNKDEAYQPMIV